jgi:hypothetical protein
MRMIALLYQGKDLTEENTEVIVEAAVIVVGASSIVL